MSAFLPNPADYDSSRAPLTLGGKAAALEHLIPRRTPEQAALARQAASDALYTAFRADFVVLDASEQTGGGA